MRKKGNEGFEWPVIDKKKKRRIMKVLKIMMTDVDEVKVKVRILFCPELIF